MNSGRARSIFLPPFWGGIKNVLLAAADLNTASILAAESASAIRSLSGAKRKTFARGEYFAFCAGFRMPAMTRPSTRCCGRRPKSAKARNRGKWAASVQRALWGFGRGVRREEIGLKQSLGSLYRQTCMRMEGRTRGPDVARGDWRCDWGPIERIDASVDAAG